MHCILFLKIFSLSFYESLLSDRPKVLVKLRHWPGYTPSEYATPVTICIPFCLYIDTLLPRSLDIIQDRTEFGSDDLAIFDELVKLDRDQSVLVFFCDYLILK